MPAIHMLRHLQQVTQRLHCLVNYWNERWRPALSLNCGKFCFLAFCPTWKMPDEPFVQSFCKALDAIDADVCRMQSRRRYAFPESPARRVHEENKDETLALAFGAHSYDLLLAI